MWQKNHHKQSTSARLSTLNTQNSDNMLPHSHKIQKTFNNIKIVILCGFITILVLRGTIDVNLDSSNNNVINQNLMEKTNYILTEIRSGTDSSNPNDQQFFNPNDTFTLE
ncbi:putative xyloglucan 6-xylosyltransferase 3 [Glycine soja]|uniref:Putative xyloglucan 6-xylosyltransferase 3 n=1 Tax=Glycine soja TaxID=3848 RepID=A0A445HMY0_GLYSO|nr:putative xyloglucan 6-xylosyltransferase 3 [Glycine soja]